MSIDTSVPVVVLSLSDAPLLHNVVSVARSLGRLGVTVYLVRGEQWMPADFSRYLRASIPLRSASNGSGIASELAGIGRSMGDRAILIPLDDVGALFVADHAEMLGRHFRFPALAADLTRSLASKRGLHMLSNRAAIPTPVSAFPNSRDELPALAERMRFPIVAKAIDPLLLHQRPEARSVVIATSLNELVDVYDRVSLGEESNLMLQEYIPGGADSIWMFNGYLDQESRCLVGFTGVKLRQCLPHTGPTSLGLCLSNPAVAEAARRLLATIGYRGIVDLGFRYDLRDGKYKLLDVNPRIGGTFRLFVATNGMDVVRALYLDLTGQPVPSSSARDGRKWIVEQYDLVASRQYHREGQLSVRQWLRSFRGVEEAAWMARDDPAPFAAMSWRSLRLAVQRIASASPRSRQSSDRGRRTREAT